MVADVFVKLYCEENLNNRERSIVKLQECMERAMDLALGLSFLKEIQVHYDMNSKPKMLVEKLQMFAYSCVSSK
jgi:hypothetical protein